MIFDQQQMAEILGISDRHLRRLASNGIKPDKSGMYDAAATVKKYVKYQLSLEENKQRTGEKNYRARREAAEAQLKEMEVDQKKGLLVERAMVIEKWDHALNILKTRLLAIPTKVSPQLIGIDNINVIKDHLDYEIVSALDELSKNEV